LTPVADVARHLKTAILFPCGVLDLYSAITH